MATNVTLKRVNATSGSTDDLHPTTDWAQIESKPSTFTPTSHTHGNITNGGEITASATIATGDHLVIADNSSGNDLTTSSITFGTGTTTFLRNDGTWGTPSGTADTNNYLTGVSGSGDGTVTFTRQGLSNLTWDASHSHSEYLPLTGGTLTGTLTSRSINMQNYTLSNVGQMTFNDPGPNEGISWSGGNFSIYESPNDLSTNSAGNLQFVSGSTRRMTVESNGNVYIGGGLTIDGSINTGAYEGASEYEAAGTNLRLKGDSSGRSGIFFQSEKDGTNINHTSDFGYIQFHPYGRDGTSGEANELLIGVSNDSTDHLILNTPQADGLRFRVGASATEYEIWHGANDGSGSGLDADLLDGQHGSYYLDYNNFTNTPTIPTNNNQLTNGAGYVTSSHTHAYVSDSGDTMTGDLTMASDGESTANDSHGVVLTARFNSTPFTRKLYMDDEANLLFGTNTIFHSGNDGSASGLHADLLDGQQGSHYLDYNNFTNTPTIPTNNNQLTNGAGYVTGSHSHSTSNITSGEFNTARLGSGTATSGYVLQSDGDGTASWAASSGGGEYEWEYVAVVKDSNTLTYSSMDDANYDYKFVIHCQATATEDTSQPYIRINGDSASEYSYQYSSITQTAETTETVLNLGDALASLIYTGADLSSYSNGGSSFSTVHTAEVIVQHSPWSTYPGNYTLVLRGWAQTHYVSQSGSSYDGMVQSTFVGTKDNLYGVTGENHRFDYTHNIAGSSTNYRIMRVYRRERK